MSRTTVVIVGLALVCGLATVVLINALLASMGTGPSTVAVVVAAEDVPVDTKLTPAMLKIQRCARQLVPEGALKSIEEAVDRDVLYPLTKNEPIVNSRLTPKGSPGRMAALIPPGMRSVTILVPTQSNSVAGFIRPGNHVDVLLTISEKGANDPTGGSTSTLVENVEILGVDKYASAPVPTGSKTAEVKDLRSVTLLATQEQSLKLIRGQDMGKLHLTLRSPGDSDPATATRVTGRNIRSPGLEEVKIQPIQPVVFKQAEKPKPAPVVVALPGTIRTLRGPNEGRLEIAGNGP